ncbi:MAG: hypothetical protein REH79_01330 [Spiroplasma sp.]|nr:hypothetical protein [Spiroplasma sp.]
MRIINKTADETIVETAKVLLQCLVDPKLSLEKKQKYTRWVSWFFDYQDAIHIKNEKQIINLEQKLNLYQLPKYYHDGLQEFKNCNLFFNQINDFNELKSLIFDYTTKTTKNNINKFSKIFINTFKIYKINLTKNFIENFHILIYTIHYHLTYIFKEFLVTTVKLLTKILQKQILIQKTEQTISLINLILQENEIFFNQIQQIHLINFIYQLEEIFDSTNQENIINLRINQLIFNQPNKITISMNHLLKINNIKFYDEIWKNNLIDEKKSKLLMHFFAYETYFIQGHNHHQIYENLILKNLIDEEKYWLILSQYKRKNKITS